MSNQDLVVLTWGAPSSMMVGSEPFPLFLIPFDLVVEEIRLVHLVSDLDAVAVCFKATPSGGVATAITEVVNTETDGGVVKTAPLLRERGVPSQNILRRGTLVTMTTEDLFSNASGYSVTFVCSRAIN